MESTHTGDQDDRPSLEKASARLHQLLLDVTEVDAFLDAIADLCARLEPGAQVRVVLEDGHPGGPNPAFSVPVEGADGVRLVGRIVDGAPSRAALTRLRVFAERAALAVAVLLRQHDRITLDTQLREALATRAVIDQALGVLMVSRRIDSHQAFELLRELSQISNRKLRDVAAEVIRTATGHPPLPPRPLVQSRERSPRRTR